MSKISIGLGIVYAGHYKGDDKVELAPEKTVVCYEACLEALERFGRLQKLVEVIRVSFAQKIPKVLQMNVTAVVVALSGKVRFQIDETFHFDQDRGVSKEDVSKRLDERLRRELRLKASEAMEEADALSRML